MVEVGHDGDDGHDGEDGHDDVGPSAHDLIVSGSP